MIRLHRAEEMDIDPETAARSRRVREIAHVSGLAVASITSAEPFEGLETLLRNRIKAGRLNGFDWYDDERARVSSDPGALLPWARSIVSVGIPYWSPTPAMPEDGIPRGRISRYAWGNDYHKVLKKRLKAFHGALKEEFGIEFEARYLADTARIVDRAVAARSGLGWYGKNACIIVPGHGSWVMLGEMPVDLLLQPDAPLNRNCGRCSICIDRCPTGAIVAPYEIDAPRCLSFQTIEQRGAIPREIRPSLGNWVFGCDVCQDVCPYTGAAETMADPDFSPPHIDRAYPDLRWLLGIGEPEYRAFFRGTAVLRAKRSGLVRNAAVALGNTGQAEDEAVLAAAMAGHDEPMVRSHAAWALGRYGTAEGRTALERTIVREPDEDTRQDMVTTLEQWGTEVRAG